MLGTKTEPRTIDDLAPAGYNPREIAETNANGLRSSLDAFGDIAGITFNATTGRLVSGHQRVAQLRAMGGRLVRDGGLAIEIDGTGQRWPVRVVEWDEWTEKAANITANNPHIAGTFTDKLQSLLGDVADRIGEDKLGDLRLDALTNDLDNAGWDDALGGLPEGDKDDCARMTFTLTSAQHEIVKAALKKATDRQMDEGNSNAAALVRIAEYYDR